MARHLPPDLSKKASPRFCLWAPRVEVTRLKRVGRLVLVCLFGALHLPAQAPGAPWRLLYEKGGFKAYEHPGPPLAYRAEGAVAFPLAEMAAVLVDIPRQKEWVNRLAESRLLEGDPLGQSVIYSRYDLPWPAKDRDAVVKCLVEEHPTQGLVRVRFHNATSPGAPSHPDCIRVPLSEGEFTLQAMGPQAVHVTYTIRIDPGGWLPDWIVRLFVRDAPFTTLKAFQTQVTQTRGQYDAFISAQKQRWEKLEAPRKRPGP